MTRIRRGGRELVVEDSEVAGYLKQGYSVIDESGREITPHKAMTYSQAMTENQALKVRETELEKALQAANQKVEALTDELSTLRSSLTAQESLHGLSVKESTPEETEAQKGEKPLKEASHGKTVK